MATVHPVDAEKILLRGSQARGRTLLYLTLCGAWGQLLYFSEPQCSHP